MRGIPNNWFSSYLSDRQQTVTVNNTTSNPATMLCGVPRGSVLGLLLFILYINYFHICSNNLFEFHLFADANLIYKHKHLDILQTNINKELSNIHDWLCANKFLLNIYKSNYVIFHPPQKKLNTNLQLIVYDRILRRENCIKYLGIFIDSNLNWKSQIDYITKNI